MFNLGLFIYYIFRLHNYYHARELRCVGADPPPLSPIVAHTASSPPAVRMAPSPPSPSPINVDRGGWEALEPEEQEFLLLEDERELGSFPASKALYLPR